MKKLLIVGFGALLHSALLFGCAILAFVGSFGAPQGGDAVKKGVSHPAVVAFLSWFFESAVAMLAWPASMFTKGMKPWSLPWVLNSVIWGFLVLLAVGWLQRRANHAAQTTPGLRPSVSDL